MVFGEKDEVNRMIAEVCSKSCVYGFKKPQMTLFGINRRCLRCCQRRAEGLENTLLGAFKLLGRKPTKPDHYIARRIQSQYIYFVDILDTDDGPMAKIRGTSKYEPIDAFYMWWSIPEPLIPLVPPPRKCDYDWPDVQHICAQHEEIPMLVYAPGEFYTLPISGLTVANTRMETQEEFEKRRNT